jgi:DNA-binding response OmpR family regulator
MLNRGQAVSRTELLDSVWNVDSPQTTNIVDVYVNYLRRKLQDTPPGRLIRTVRGQGYMIPLDEGIACRTLSGICVRENEGSNRVQ